MKKKVRIYRAQDGIGKFLHKKQEGGMLDVNERGYPGQQEQTPVTQEQLTQLVVNDISQGISKEQVIVKLATVHGLDPMQASQFYDQIFGLLEDQKQKDIDSVENPDETETVDNPEEEVVEEETPDTLNYDHTSNAGLDIAQEDDGLDVANEDLGTLESDLIMRRGGLVRADEGASIDDTLWNTQTYPIQFPGMDTYLPDNTGMDQYINQQNTQTVADRAYPDPTGGMLNNTDTASNYAERVPDPNADTSEYKKGGTYKTDKRKFVNSILNLVKKQMGGQEKPMSNDADPTGQNVRTNNLQAFIGTVKNQSQIAIAKKEAEEQYDKMMQQQQMMIQQQQPPMYPMAQEGGMYPNMDEDPENPMHHLEAYANTTHGIFDQPMVGLSQAQYGGNTEGCFPTQLPNGQVITNCFPRQEQRDENQRQIDAGSYDGLGATQEQDIDRGNYPKIFDPNESHVTNFPKRFDPYAPHVPSYVNYGNGQVMYTPRRRQTNIGVIPGMQGLQGMPNFGYGNGMPPITKLDVRRSGLFGRPRRYTAEFGQGAMLPGQQGSGIGFYGYGAPEIKKSPARVIVENVASTVNNEAIKEVAKVTPGSTATTTAVDPNKKATEIKVVPGSGSGSGSGTGNTNKKSNTGNSTPIKSNEEVVIDPKTGYASKDQFNVKQGIKIGNVAFVTDLKNNDLYTQMQDVWTGNPVENEWKKNDPTYMPSKGGAKNVNSNPTIGPNGEKRHTLGRMYPGETNAHFNQRVKEYNAKPWYEKMVNTNPEKEWADSQSNNYNDVGPMQYLAPTSVGSGAILGAGKLSAEVAKKLASKVAPKVAKVVSKVAKTPAQVKAAKALASQKAMLRQINKGNYGYHEEGGIIDTSTIDPNNPELMRFVYGGNDPYVTQQDINYSNSKDVTDPYFQGGGELTDEEQKEADAAVYDKINPEILAQIQKEQAASSPNPYMEPVGQRDKSLPDSANRENYSRLVENGKVYTGYNPDHKYVGADYVPKNTTTQQYPQGYYPQQGGYNPNFLQKFFPGNLPQVVGSYGEMKKMYDPKTGLPYTGGFGPGTQLTKLDVRKSRLNGDPKKYTMYFNNSEMDPRKQGLISLDGQGNGSGNGHGNDNTNYSDDRWGRHDERYNARNKRRLNRHGIDVPEETRDNPYLNEREDVQTQIDTEGNSIPLGENKYNSNVVNTSTAVLDNNGIPMTDDGSNLMIENHPDFSSVSPSESSNVREDIKLNPEATKLAAQKAYGEYGDVSAEFGNNGPQLQEAFNNIFATQGQDAADAMMSNAFKERNANIKDMPVEQPVEQTAEQPIDEATGEPINVPTDQPVNESNVDNSDAVSEAPMQKISSNNSAIDFMNNYNTNPEFAAMVDDAKNRAQGTNGDWYGTGDSQNLESPTVRDMANYNNEANALNKFTSAIDEDQYAQQEGLPIRQAHIDQNTNYPDKIEMPAELQDWQNKQNINNSNNQVVNNKNPRQGTNQNNRGNSKVDNKINTKLNNIDIKENPYPKDSEMHYVYEELTPEEKKLHKIANIKNESKRQGDKNNRNKELEVFNHSNEGREQYYNNLDRGAAQQYYKSDIEPKITQTTNAYNNAIDAAKTDAARNKLVKEKEIALNNINKQFFKGIDFDQAGSQYTPPPKNITEGNDFRKYMHEFYPNISKSFNLDVKGNINSSEFKDVWNKYGARFLYGNRSDDQKVKVRNTIKSHMGAFGHLRDGGALNKFIPKASPGLEVGSPVTYTGNKALEGMTDVQMISLNPGIQDLNPSSLTGFMNNNNNAPARNMSQDPAQMNIDKNQIESQNAEKVYNPNGDFAIDIKQKNMYEVDPEVLLQTGNALGRGYAGMMNNIQNRKNTRNMYNDLNADNLYSATTDRDRGDYTKSGSARGELRFDEQGANSTGRFAQYGGTSNEDNMYDQGGYFDGDEAYMTEDQIKQFLEAGGEIEYL